MIISEETLTAARERKAEHEKKQLQNVGKKRSGLEVMSDTIGNVVDLCKLVGKTCGGRAQNARSKLEKEKSPGGLVIHHGMDIPEPVLYSVVYALTFCVT